MLAHARADFRQEIGANRDRVRLVLAGFGDPAKVPDDQLSAGVASLRVAFAWAHSIAASAEAVVKDYDKAEAALWTCTPRQD